MGPLEDFVGWTIKNELTNMTLNNYQPEPIHINDLIFLNYVKLIATFNTPTTLQK